MLKHRVGDEIRFVAQPDHAALAGLLAAHWGGGDFAPPGGYAPCEDPEALRAETIFGIAQHDNGWWESEADPELDAADSLPQHFLDSTLEQSLERWTRGVARFFEPHPYAALLISHHAYWLNAPKSDPGFEPTFSPRTAQGPQGELLEQFLEYRREDHRRLKDRLRQSAWGAAAVEPALLNPHVRLLQTLDRISLRVCSGSEEGADLPGVPVRGWDDRGALRLESAGRDQWTLSPYPLDQDPLEAAVPARVIADGDRPGDEFASWWAAQPVRLLPIRLGSA